MSELSDLHELATTDPEALKKIFLDNPVLAQKILDADRHLVAGEKRTVDSFKHIYEQFFDRPLPKICYGAAEEFIWALENKEGVMLEAWRGFGKSTFFTAWCPSVMGWRPVGSTMLIRINGQKAKEMGKVIAQLIETSLGWKKIFPHVIPDMKAGWSVEDGFMVMDTRITGLPGSLGFAEGYARWMTLCLADHLSEKSLLCTGLEGGSIIGSHPTNGEWFDDLHDEKNTRSPAEMQKVIDLYEGNVAPTWVGAGGSPTLGTFCTPWSKNPPDVYQKMLETGLFKHIKIPVFKEDENGEVIPTHNKKGQPALSEWVGKKVKLAWPENFDMDTVIKMMNIHKTRFGQMALLDIELSRPKNMTYMEFPNNEIQWDVWPMVLGVDPVAWIKDISKGHGLSHFAGAQFLKTPYNSVVLAGGFVEKIDALEGERRVAETQRTFAKTYENASIESDGAGVMWIALITRTGGIRYHSHQVSELGPGSKLERQYRFLQPLFACGAIKVSDADTPFLNAVREYLERFPNFPDTHYLADVGDAMAIGALDIPEIWSGIVMDNAEQNIFSNQETKIPTRGYGLGSYEYGG